MSLLHSVAENQTLTLSELTAVQVAVVGLARQVALHKHNKVRLAELVAQRLAVVAVEILQSVLTVLLELAVMVVQD
jgi:hypothetical protein